MMATDPHLPIITRAIDRIRIAWPTPLSEAQADILDQALTLACEEVEALVNPGRLLVNQRRIRTATCAVCGQAFETFDARARTCSTACRSKAWRQRRQATTA